MFPGRFGQLKVSLLMTILLVAGDPSSIAAEGEDPFPPQPDIETGHLFGLPPLSWSNDPFRKLPGVAVQLAEDADPPANLEAVIVSRQGMEALIDGRRVIKGDEVGARTVSEIGENYVVLEDEESTIELNIPASRRDRTGLAIIPVSDGAKQREADLEAARSQQSSAGSPPVEYDDEEEEE